MVFIDEVRCLSSERQGKQSFHGVGLCGLAVRLAMIWRESSKTPQFGAAAPWQSGRGRPLEHEIFDAVFFTVFALAAFVAVLVHGVNIRLEPFDFRIGIEPAVAAGDQRLFHKLDRADDVAALVLRQDWMTFALEQANVRVVAYDDVKVAMRADFLAKPHVTGVKPVVTAGGDNSLLAGCGRHRWRFGKSFQFARSENAIRDFLVE